MNLFKAFMLIALAIPVHLFSASSSSLGSALSCSSSSGSQPDSTASVFHEVLLSMQANNNSDPLTLCTAIADNPQRMPKHRALALALMGTIYAVPEAPEHNPSIARGLYEKALAVEGGLTGAVRDQVLEYQKRIAPELFLIQSSQSSAGSSSPNNLPTRDRPGLPKKFRAYLRHKEEAEKLLRAPDEVSQAAPNFTALLDVVKKERKALRKEKKKKSHSKRSNKKARRK